MPCCVALAVRQGPSQRGSRVAYLEWIGEVKRARRLGKRVGRGPPPSCPRPADVSATPPRRRPLRPRLAPPRERGLSPCRRHPDMEQAACLHTSRTAACVPAPPRRVLVTTITVARDLAAPGWEPPFFREGKPAARPLPGRRCARAPAARPGAARAGRPATTSAPRAATRSRGGI